MYSRCQLFCMIGHRFPLIFFSILIDESFKIPFEDALWDRNFHFMFSFAKSEKLWDNERSENAVCLSDVQFCAGFCKLAFALFTSLKYLQWKSLNRPGGYVMNSTSFTKAAQSASSSRAVATRGHCRGICQFHSLISAVSWHQIVPLLASKFLLLEWRRRIPIPLFRLQHITLFRKVFSLAELRSVSPLGHWPNFVFLQQKHWNLPCRYDKMLHFGTRQSAQDIPFPKEFEKYFQQKSHADKTFYDKETFAAVIRNIRGVPESNFWNNKKIKWHGMKRISRSSSISEDEDLS